MSEDDIKLTNQINDIMKNPPVNVSVEDYIIALKVVKALITLTNKLEDLIVKANTEMKKSTGFLEKLKNEA